MKNNMKFFVLLVISSVVAQVHAWNDRGNFLVPNGSYAVTSACLVKCQEGGRCSREMLNQQILNRQTLNQQAEPCWQCISECNRAQQPDQMVLFNNPQPMLDNPEIRPVYNNTDPVYLRQEQRIAAPNDFPEMK